MLSMREPHGSKFRGRELGMSYWPFVIFLIAAIIMTVLWYQETGLKDQANASLKTARADAARYEKEVIALKNKYTDLADQTGFTADDGSGPDAEKMRAAIASVVDQMSNTMVVRFPDNRYQPSGDGGRIEQVDNGATVAHYFPPAAEMNGETMTLEALLPLFVEGVKRMGADVQQGFDLKKAAEDTLAAERTAFQETLAAKDAAINDRQTQIQAAEANIAELGSQLREQISTLEGQLSTARQSLDEEKERARTEIAKLEGKVNQGVSEIKTLVDREKPFASEGPDGEILAARDGTAWVNLGRRKLLMPGTVFTVLGRRKGGALYQKGTVKVTSVDETMSRASIVELASRLDPIVEGDLVQSAAYSPNRQMRFFLLGEFRRLGKSQLESRLESLGAKVDDDVTTLTHYVVLGSPGPAGENLESTDAYKKAMQYGTTILTEAQLASFTSF